jgi:hypothetical protein
MNNKGLFLIEKGKLNRILESSQHGVKELGYFYVFTRMFHQLFAASCTSSESKMRAWKNFQN